MRYFLYPASYTLTPGLMLDLFLQKLSPPRVCISQLHNLAPAGSHVTCFAAVAAWWGPVRFHAGQQDLRLDADVEESHSSAFPPRAHALWWLVDEPRLRVLYPCALCTSYECLWGGALKRYSTLLQTFCLRRANIEHQHNEQLTACGEPGCVRQRQSRRSAYAQRNGPVGDMPRPYTQSPKGIQ